MKTSVKSIAAGIAGMTVLAAGSAVAQDAPRPVLQEEILTPPAMASTAEGPQWRAFSRGANSAYLIDPASVRQDGTEIRVRVARVPVASPPGNYSHVIDEFAVRCDADESRLVASTEVDEDGQPVDTYAADEPWTEIRPGSFDEGVQQVGCGEATPVGAPFPTIRAYIDAGRP